MPPITTCNQELIILYAPHTILTKRKNVNYCQQQQNVVVSNQIISYSY